MPAEHRLDRTALDAVSMALSRTGTAALEASHELLAHYADTGDAPTQRSVDTLIDHAADALRSLNDCLADISGELESAATAATSHTRRVSGSLSERSSARHRPGREGRA